MRTRHSPVMTSRHSGFVCAFLVMVSCAASCDQKSKSQVPRDMRWTRYASQRHDPVHEIELNNQDLFTLTFSVSADRGLFAYSRFMKSRKNATCEIRVMELKSGKQLSRLKGHVDSTQCIAITRDGRRVVSGGGEKGDIRLWDIDRAEEISQAIAHQGYVRNIACSPGSDKAASRGDDRSIVLWYLEKMQTLRRMVGHSGGIRCLVWSSDGRNILSGSWDGSIRLWDISSGKALFVGQAGYGRVMSLALSPDGKYALSSYLNGPNQPVILWDLEAKREINRFEVPGNPWRADRQLHTASVAFSPDGQTALFGTAFGSVIWWDLSQWREISHNAMFRESLEYVTFSKAGTHAISAGCDIDRVEENAKIRSWKLRD